MSKVRRINVSQIEGNSANDDNSSEIRPFGEIGVYADETGDRDKPVLLMFDGQRTHLKSKVLQPGILYGSNADSGDGQGLDTIRLVPDATLYDQGSDQYLIVDPTAPNHIHIRAGGTIDHSNAALILGGENSNVEIQAGENPPVYVRADGNAWTFDTNGVLTLPGEGIIRSNDDTIILKSFDTAFNVSKGIRIGTNGHVYFELGDDPAYFQIEEGEGDAQLVARTNLTIMANGGSTIKQWTFGTDGSLTLPNDGVISAGGSGGLTLGGNFDVKIIADYTDNDRTWTFRGGDSTLKLPVNGSIEGGSLEQVGSEFVVELSYFGSADNGGASGVNLNNTEQNQTIQIGWTAAFRSGGTYTVQGTSLIGDRLVISMNDGTGFFAELPVTFTSPDYVAGAESPVVITSNNYSWNFGNDGTLTVAASSIGGGLGLIYSPADKSLWLSGTNVYKTTDGNGVVLNGGQNAGTGRGGGISLFGGNSTGGTGGGIFIETGIGQGGADNGTIAIGTAYAKTITIGKASQSANNRFFGNLIGNVENDDDITITVANDDSTTYAWNFGNTGDLTIPGNIESNGSIQLVSNASTVQMRGTNAFGSITYDDSDGDILIATTGTITIMGAAGSAVNIGGGTSGNITLGNGSNQTTINGNLTFNGARTISPVATTTFTGSDITIQGGTSTDLSASGGDVFIEGGLGVGGGDNGTVRIDQNAAGGVWIGKADGTGDDIQTYSRLRIHRGVTEDYEAKADATGVVEHDCDDGHLFYHTSPDANWTVNLTNLNAYSGMATNITIVIVQGDPAYYPNALQIGGSAQTILWQGGAAPTPTANGVDIVTFSILYDGSNYTVLGQMTDFSAVA